MSISDDNDLQVYIERPPSPCFVNNYFKSGLLAWEAHMDIQPVINHYKEITHMWAYLSKTKYGRSYAMAQAVYEAWDKSLNNYERIRLIAKPYAIKRECNVQKAVYHIMVDV